MVFCKSCGRCSARITRAKAFGRAAGDFTRADHGFFSARMLLSALQSSERRVRRNDCGKRAPNGCVSYLYLMKASVIRPCERRPGKARGNMPYNTYFLQIQKDLQAAANAAVDKTGPNRFAGKSDYRTARRRRTCPYSSCLPKHIFRHPPKKHICRLYRRLLFVLEKRHGVFRRAVF